MKLYKIKNISNLAKHIYEHTDTDTEFVHFGHIHLSASVFNGSYEELCNNTDDKTILHNFKNSINTFSVLEELNNPKIIFFCNERIINLARFGLDNIGKTYNRIEEDVVYIVHNSIYRIIDGEIFIGSGVNIIFAYFRDKWDAEIQAMVVV